MTATINEEGKGALSIHLVGAASAANGGLGAIANPEGVKLIILRTTLLVHAPSTGAANLSAGVAATADAAATDIINALAMNGVAADTPYNGHVMQNGAKTEIAAPAVWTPSKFITFTGSATTVGLDATLYVEYLRQ